MAPGAPPAMIEVNHPGRFDQQGRGSPARDSIFFSYQVAGLRNLPVRSSSQGWHWQAFNAPSGCPTKLGYVV